MVFAVWLEKEFLLQILHEQHIVIQILLTLLESGEESNLLLCSTETVQETRLAALQA